MKHLLTALLIVIALPTLAETAKEISGTITIAKEAKLAPTGKLYVFARKPGQTSGPPVAVLQVPEPKFPYAFTLSAANAMIPGTPFEGPYAITARFSPSGDALDKSGPQGQAKSSAIKPGQKDVQIELKTQK